MDTYIHVWCCALLAGVQEQILSKSIPDWHFYVFSLCYLFIFCKRWRFGLDKQIQCRRYCCNNESRKTMDRRNKRILWIDNPYWCVSNRLFIYKKEIFKVSTSFLPLTIHHSLFVII